MMFIDVKNHLPFSFGKLNSNVLCFSWWNKSSTKIISSSLPIFQRLHFQLFIDRSGILSGSCYQHICISIIRTPDLMKASSPSPSLPQLTTALEAASSLSITQYSPNKLPQRTFTSTPSSRRHKRCILIQEVHRR